MTPEEYTAREKVAEARKAENERRARFPHEILGEAIAKGLLGEGWRQRAQIIEGYVPPYAKQSFGRVVVRYKAFGAKHDVMLRHSGGPRQGHFWDIYGDDYQNVGLALRALLEAYRPHGIVQERTSFDSEEHRQALRSQ